ncbi:protein of unknown function [Cupriavidus taiwanensis]|nr:protein of unknown function [Cupriavidus taiwanensis]
MFAASYLIKISDVMRNHDRVKQT